jgi:hypothetical protein
MDNITRARAFFQHNGRDIDKARFGYHFDALALDDMPATLARYQNEDGGFGHGLEPDITAPDSNPFATELALLYCLQADAPRDHPLLQRTVTYLERTQDADGGWRFSESVYTYLLAPWFQGWQWPNINPSCTLAGLLKGLGLGSQQLHVGVERLFAQQAKVDDLLGDEFYAVRPYAYYFLANWSHPQRELYSSGVLWWLIRQHVTGKIQDAGHFFEYVRTPQTDIGRRMPAAILAAQLDTLAAEQQDDGGWPSPYAEHWRGPATVQGLLTLQAFGRGDS